MRQGFSLVELSIVLVILGLLTGGILAGQNLIRAAELRSITTQVSQYQTAVMTFRDKYFSIPGDFKDATKFWSLDATATGCVSNSGTTAGTPGTCDGNGGGSLDDAAAGGQTGEKFQFWRHLALAGLIEGSYTGIAGADNPDSRQAGINAPNAKADNGHWWATQNSQASTFCFNTPASAGRTLIVAGGTGTATTPILTPEEQWNIDTKLDDGLPTRGKIMARYQSTNICTTAADRDDLTATYKLDSTAKACILHVMAAF